MEGGRGMGSYLSVPGLAKGVQDVEARGFEVDRVDGKDVVKAPVS